MTMLRRILGLAGHGRPLIGLLLVLPLIAGCAGQLSDPSSQLNHAVASFGKFKHHDFVLASTAAAQAPATDTMAPYRKECWDALAAWIPDTGLTLGQFLQSSGLPAIPDGAGAAYFFELLAEQQASGVLTGGTSSLLQKVRGIIPPLVLARCGVLRVTADRLLVDFGIVAATVAPK